MRGISSKQNARGRTALRNVIGAAVVSSALVVTGCSFDGLNSLPVPGAEGTGSGSYELMAMIPNAANLVQNAPVLINDATVGSVGKIEVKNWQAELTLRLNEGTQVPVGSYVMVGLTSVLGSLNLQIVQPENADRGTMAPGDQIPATSCPEQENIAPPTNTEPIPDINSAQQVAACTYPTTEQVLSSLSVVLNGGGLAQVGDIVHEMNAALAGRQDLLRDLIPRLNTLVGELNDQRENIIRAMEGLDRLTGTINKQAPVVEKALADGPKILKLLVDQRVHFTDALGALSRMSRTTDDILKANSEDIEVLTSNLVPVLDQLQSTGPSLTQSLGILLTFPFAEQAIPQVVRGDYLNAVINLDLTFGRLQRGALASVGVASQFYGPEGMFGKPAGAAGRGDNPFTGPLTDDPPPVTAGEQPTGEEGP
ncbi:phospholipid/cholesterol/gamma-HCH transport system substrate-binding protein [Williamsia limnetica]|uniref:Phospholipid/cholesterol/gamma-HCH transport system substrate-binding protein n=1 Tax=Williamsia limnetica TaxID=882452 RepID=A0A318RQ21_WILLI|nr:MCE family protein [Williamsia limnetica]PYE20023.1 phospholipid/cholesterol/gamma-HCH transport system substrate-binding protein [Williamsia limnetica]